MDTNTERTDSQQDAPPVERYEPHDFTPADSGYWTHDEDAGTVTINPASIDARTVDAEKFFAARSGAGQ